MSALYFSALHPVIFFFNAFLFLSRTSRHKGCHVEKGKWERGRNVLPKCLFARLSGVWSPWELILLRLRLICFLCCLLKVITSCLEIYKRTAQGEFPPKGVGTEWKFNHTSGQCRWDTADLCTGVLELCVCDVRERRDPLECAPDTYFCTSVLFLVCLGLKLAHIAVGGALVARSVVPMSLCVCGELGYLWWRCTCPFLFPVPDLSRCVWCSCCAGEGGTNTRAAQTLLPLPSSVS